MNHLVLSLLIGAAAGVIDIIPMLAQRLPMRSIVSAFLQYFFVSIIIVNIDLFGIAWYLQGALISFALALPVMVIVARSDRRAVPPMAVMSVLVGTLVSVAGHFLK